MRRILQDAGLADAVHVDSAGTLNLHTGSLPDPRMRKAARRRGYELTHRARQVRRSDFAEFDLLLVMDRANQEDIAPFAPGDSTQEKLKLFCEFCTEHDETEVPDPYYGGDADFEIVLNLLEDGCTELARRIKEGTLTGGS